MKRRSFLRLLGLAPAAPVVASLPSVAPAVAAPLEAAVEVVTSTEPVAALGAFAYMSVMVSAVGISADKFVITELE